MASGSSSSQIVITQRLNPPLQNQPTAPPAPPTASEASENAENLRLAEDTSGCAKNWTTKEKIFLVSCVLVYGDSNWSFVSEQLRRFMQITSTADDVLIINSNNNKLPRSEPVNQFKRSIYECSSQYKHLMKRYSGQLRPSDPKRLYDILVKERIAELNNITLHNRRQYADLNREMQQIISSDVKNFEQLRDAWNRIKQSELKLNESNAVAADKKPVAEKLNLDQIASSIAKNRDDLDDTAIEKNLETIERLSELQSRIKEKAARIEHAQQQRLQQQLLEQQQQQQLQLQKQKEQQELEQAAAAEAAAASQLAAAQQQGPPPQLQPQTTKPVATPEKPSTPKKQPPSLSIASPTPPPDTGVKTRGLRSLTSSSSEHPKTRQVIKQEIKEEKMDEPQTAAVADDDDKFSSDDDVPLGEIQKQSIQKPEENSSAAVNKDESGEADDRSRPAEPVATATPTSKRKKANPKKLLRVVDSSASSLASSSSSSMPSSPSASLSGSDGSSSSSVAATGSVHSSSENEEVATTATAEKKQVKQTKAKEAEKPARPLPTRHSLRSDSFNRGSTCKKPDPLSEDDKSKAKRPAAAKKRTREELEESAGDEEEDHEDGNTDDDESGEEEEVDDDDGGDSVTTERDEESQSTRSSLRNKDNSKSRRISVPTQQQSQMKRRSGAAGARTPAKPLQASVASGKSKTKLSPSVKEPQKSPGPRLSLQTGGLVSIIKSEPVQISASSTILNVVGDLPKRTSSQSVNDMDDSAIQSSSSSVSSSSAATFKFEDEKAYRAWKKSILMVFNNIACHKHATVFMQPVKEEIAPGYKKVVHRPMDLSTIKRNIENGSIKSTREFQRDVMLMFTNAIMYNSSNHNIHKISLEMYKEVLNNVENLLNAQEAMGEDSKPLRFKEIRSSTASDRGVGGNLGDNEASSNTTAPTNHNNNNNDSTAELVVNLLMTSKKDFSSSSVKDETLETGSMKSSSSMSTIPVRSASMRKSSKTAAAAAATEPAAVTPASSSKKRRPSAESPATAKESTPTTQSKSSKRRKR